MLKHVCGKIKFVAGWVMGQINLRMRDLFLTADSLRGGSNNPFARSPKKNHHPSSSAHIGWCAVEGTSVAPTDSPRLEWVEYI